MINNKQAIDELEQTNKDVKKLQHSLQYYISELFIFALNYQFEFERQFKRNNTKKATKTTPQRTLPPLKGIERKELLKREVYFVLFGRTKIIIFVRPYQFIHWALEELDRIDLQVSKRIEQQQSFESTIQPLQLWLLVGCYCNGKQANQQMRAQFH